MASETQIGVDSERGPGLIQMHHVYIVLFKCDAMLHN